MQEATLAAEPEPHADIGADQAKKIFFEHWAYLEALAKRRFPYSENLAHESVHYMLNHLEADNWRRIRSWKQQGRFTTYLTTMATRLLTDFSRKKFGHIRKPKWLVDKQDDVWDTAYRLLIVEKYAQHEVIEMLSLRQPLSDRAHFRNIVHTIEAQCCRPGTHTDASESLDEQALRSPENFEPEQLLVVDDHEIMEALRCFVSAGEKAATPNSARAKKILSKIQPMLKLSDEDRLILQLRYSDGLSVKDIVNLLRLPGDGYKRIYKIIKNIKNALHATGLLEA